jgi:hypothetical protein
MGHRVARLTSIHFNYVQTLSKRRAYRDDFEQYIIDIRLCGSFKKASKEIYRKDAEAQSLF